MKFGYAWVPSLDIKQFERRVLGNGFLPAKLDGVLNAYTGYLFYTFQDIKLPLVWDPASERLFHYLRRPFRFGCLVENLVNQRDKGINRERNLRFENS